MKRPDGGVPRPGKEKLVVEENLEGVLIVPIAADGSAVGTESQIRPWGVAAWPKPERGAAWEGSGIRGSLGERCRLR